MTDEKIELNIETLTTAVKSGYSAIRLIAKLQPAGGPGSKVFPPSHSGGHYAWETRILEDNVTVRTVLLDSVQSQANRMEQALKEAYLTKQLIFPLLSVDFGTNFFDIGEITTLDAPHRIADAIFRDSLLGDVKFSDTDIAKAYSAANQQNATALYKYCPHALIFGIWDSTGSSGGLGNKFQRVIVSEIIGINAVEGKITSSRICPLGTKALDIYETDEGGWTANIKESKLDAKGNPILLKKKKSSKGTASELNHTNIPPTIGKKPDDRSPIDETLGGGVTIDYAKQITVLSLPALRRLHFPINEQRSDSVDVSARTVLAAMGLAAIVHQPEKDGYNLRSRCDLIPDGRFTFELVNNFGESKIFTLDIEGVNAIFLDAVKQAEAVGLNWPIEKITLQPQKSLIDLVRISRETSEIIEG